MSFYFRNRNRNRHCFGRNQLYRQQPHFTTPQSQPMAHFHTASLTPPSSFKSRDGTKWTFLYEEIINQEEIQRVPSLAERFAEKQTEGVFGDLYIKEETCFEETDPMFVEDLVNEIVMVNGVYRWYRTLSRTSYTRRIFRKYRKRFVFGRADTIKPTMSSIEYDQQLLPNEESINANSQNLLFSQSLKDDLTTIKRSSSDMSANETDIDHIVLEPTTKRYITEIRLPSKQEIFKTEIKNKLINSDQGTESPVMRCKSNLFKGQIDVQLDDNNVNEQQNDDNNNERRVSNEIGFPFKHNSLKNALPKKYKSNDSDNRKSFNTYGQRTADMPITSALADYERIYEARKDEQNYRDNTNDINNIDSSSTKRRIPRPISDIYTDDTELCVGRKTDLWETNEMNKSKRIHLSNNSDEITHSGADKIYTETKSSEIKENEKRPDVVNFVSTFPRTSLIEGVQELKEISKSARYSLPCRTLTANQRQETVKFSRDINDEEAPKQQQDITMKTGSLDNVIEWHLQIPQKIGQPSNKKDLVGTEIPHPLSDDIITNHLHTNSRINQIMNWPTQETKISAMCEKDPMISRTSLEGDVFVAVSDDSEIPTSSDVVNIQTCYDTEPDVTISPSSQRDEARTEFVISHFPEDIIDWHMRQIPHHTESEHVVNDDIISLPERFNKTMSVECTNADKIKQSHPSVVVPPRDDVEIFISPQQKECQSEATAMPSSHHCSCQDIINWHLQLRPTSTLVVGKANKAKDKPKVLSDVQRTGGIQNIRNADDIQRDTKFDRHWELDKQKNHLGYKDDCETTHVLPVQLRAAENVNTDQCFDVLYPCMDDGGKQTAMADQIFDSKDMNEIVAMDNKSIICTSFNEDNVHKLRHNDAVENVSANDQALTPSTNEPSKYAVVTNIGQRLELNQAHTVQLTEEVGQSVDDESRAECEPIFYDATNETIEDFDVINQLVGKQKNVCEQTLLSVDDTDKIAQEFAESIQSYPLLSDQEMGEPVKAHNYATLPNDHHITFSQDDKIEMLTHEITRDSPETPDYFEQLHLFPNLKLLKENTEKYNDENDNLQNNEKEVCKQMEITGGDIIQGSADDVKADRDKCPEKQDDQAWTNGSIQSIIEWHFLPRQSVVIQHEGVKHAKDDLPSKCTRNELGAISDIVDWHLNPLRRLQATPAIDMNKITGTPLAEQAIYEKTSANAHPQTTVSQDVPRSVPILTEDVVSSAPYPHKLVDPSSELGNENHQLNKIENVFSNVRAVEKLLPCGQSLNDELLGQTASSNGDTLTYENNSEHLTDSDDISSTVGIVSSFDKGKTLKPQIFADGVSTTDKSMEPVLGGENIGIQFHTNHYHSLFRLNFHRKLIDFLTMRNKNLAIDRSSCADDMFLPQSQPIDQTEESQSSNIVARPQLVAEESFFDLSEAEVTTDAEESITSDVSLEQPGVQESRRDITDFASCPDEIKLPQIKASQFVRTPKQDAYKNASGDAYPMTARHFYSVQKQNLTKLLAECSKRFDATENETALKKAGANKEPVLSMDSPEAYVQKGLASDAGAKIIVDSPRPLTAAYEICDNNPRLSDICEESDRSASLPMVARHYHAILRGSNLNVPICEKLHYIEPLYETEMTNNVIPSEGDKPTQAHMIGLPFSGHNLSTELAPANLEAVCNFPSHKSSIDSQHYESNTHVFPPQKHNKSLDDLIDGSSIHLHESLDKTNENESTCRKAIEHSLKDNTAKHKTTSESGELISEDSFIPPRYEADKGFVVPLKKHEDSSGSAEALTTNKKRVSTYEVATPSLKGKECSITSLPDAVKNETKEIVDNSLKNEDIVSSSIDEIESLKRESKRDEKIQPSHSAIVTDDKVSVLSSKNEPSTSIPDQPSTEHEEITKAVSTKIAPVYDKIIAEPCKFEIPGSSIKVSPASTKRSHRMRTHGASTQESDSKKPMSIPVIDITLIFKASQSVKVKILLPENSLGLASILKGFKECLRKRLEDTTPIRQDDNSNDSVVRSTPFKFSSFQTIFDTTYPMPSSPSEDDYIQAIEEEKTSAKADSTDCEASIKHKSVFTAEKSPISPDVGIRDDKIRTDDVPKKSSSKQDVDCLTSSSDFSTISNLTNEDDEKCPKSQNIRGILRQHASLMKPKPTTNTISISQLQAQSGSKYSGIMHIMKGFNDRIKSVSKHKAVENVEESKNVNVPETYKGATGIIDWPSAVFGIDRKFQSAVDDVQRYFAIQNKQTFCLDSMIGPVMQSAQSKDIDDEHRHSRRSLIEYFKDARETVDCGNNTNAVGFDPSFFNCERIDNIDRVDNEPTVITGLNDFDIASIQNQIITITDEPWQITPPSKQISGSDQTEERALVRASNAYDNIIKSTSHLADVVASDATITKQVSSKLSDSSNSQSTKNMRGSQTCSKHIENQARLSEANARLLHESCADQLTISQMTMKKETPVSTETGLSFSKTFRSKLPVPTERLFETKGKPVKQTAGNDNHLGAGESKTHIIIEPIETLVHRSENLSKKLDRDENRLRDLKEDLTKHFTPTLLTDYEPRLAMCAKKDDLEFHPTNSVTADVAAPRGKSGKPNGKNIPKSVFYGAKGCDEKLKESLKRLKLSQPDFVRKYHHWTDCDSEVSKQANRDSVRVNEIPRLRGSISEVAEESDTVFDTLVCKLQTDESLTSKRYQSHSDTSSSSESLTSIRQRR